MTDSARSRTDVDLDGIAPELVMGHECAGCGEYYTDLPVVDTEDWTSRRYCTDECLDRTSERHWTAARAS